MTTGQNFATAKTLAWSAYILRTTTGTVRVNIKKSFNQNFLKSLELHENHMSQTLCCRHFVRMFFGTASLALFLACS